MSKVVIKKIIFVGSLVFIVTLFFYFLYLHESKLPAPCDARGLKNCLTENLPYKNSNLSNEERVDDLMSRMTTKEKIGQMALVEKNSVHKKEDLADYGIGALLSGFGAKPETNTGQAWLEMVNEFQQYAHQSRLEIPLLYGVDAIHGQAAFPGQVIFPHQIGLAAANNQNLVEQIAQATAKQLNRTGIHWNFAPNLDVAQDQRWGRYYETFGSNPQITANLGAAFVKGSQNKDNYGFEVLASAKHFIGTGEMAWGTSINHNFEIDQGETQADEIRLRQIHLTPFKAAIEAGVGSIMVGLNKLDHQQISANKYWITDVLKNELGFTGFVVSDWYGVYEISSSKYNSLVTAINAGIDLVMLPFDYKSFVYYTDQAFQSGDIPQARIDDAVRRILISKFRSGLFDRPLSKSYKYPESEKEKEQNLARQAVRQSLVLLKNQNHTLPISRYAQSIKIAGSSADNLGRQVGAWTIEWQGVDGNWIEGTTILEGIKEAAAQNQKIQYNQLADFEKKEMADLGIAVVGEDPYAEGWGDNPYPALSEEDLQTIKKLKDQSKKLIVIIISGRPLDIKKYSDDWGAVIAAWLPGTEGAGIADVIFGDYAFTGKLPTEWEIE